MKDIMNCKNLSVGESEENPRNIMILESEGQCAMAGPLITSLDVTKPWKIWQVNIISEEKPKLANIGDYWDDDTVGKFIELLTYYQDLFPTNLLELKGIIGELEVMKITLKHDARPVKQHPYILSPRYKKKVKEELDKTVATCIIERA